MRRQRVNRNPISCHMVWHQRCVGETQQAEKMAGRPPALPLMTTVKEIFDTVDWLQKQRGRCMLTEALFCELQDTFPRQEMGQALTTITIHTTDQPGDYRIVLVVEGNTVMLRLTTGLGGGIIGAKNFDLNDPTSIQQLIKAIQEIIDSSIPGEAYSYS